MVKQTKHNASYIQRRKELVASIKAAFPDKKGAVVLFGAFESERHRFRQDSSMYYFSGIEEPASVLVITLDGDATVYIPEFTDNRAQWVGGALMLDERVAQRLGVSRLQYMGKPHRGYSVLPMIVAEQYAVLIAALRQHQTIFVCCPAQPSAHFIHQQVMVQQLGIAAGVSWDIQDMSALVSRMRRKKSQDEIASIYNAVDITMAAQEAAAQYLHEGITEAQIQAGVEFVFAESEAVPAFPSIVASGHNATTLHYHSNAGTLRAGDVVLVDIGAELSCYCADLSRTYPVSGIFDDRQRELYQIVLDTQMYVAEAAKPGVWLCNKEHPEQSLHHQALAFLEKKGFAKYFTHTIGHFLGLDVHDVGSLSEPLQEGDVITIEPGLYLSEERLGVRIEDNYWITKHGAECLSEPLPRTIHEVETLAQTMIENMPSEKSEDDACEDDCCSHDETH